MKKYKILAILTIILSIPVAYADLREVTGEGENSNYYFTNYPEKAEKWLEKEYGARFYLKGFNNVGAQKLSYLSPDTLVNGNFQLNLRNLDEGDKVFVVENGGGFTIVRDGKLMRVHGTEGAVIRPSFQGGEKILEVDADTIPLVAGEGKIILNHDGNNEIHIRMQGNVELNNDGAKVGPGSRLTLFNPSSNELLKLIPGEKEVSVKFRGSPEEIVNRNDAAILFDLNKFNLVAVSKGDYGKLIVKEEVLTSEGQKLFSYTLHKKNGEDELLLHSNSIPLLAKLKDRTEIVKVPGGDYIAIPTKDEGEEKGKLVFVGPDGNEKVVFSDKSNPTNYEFGASRGPPPPGTSFSLKGWPDGTRNACAMVVSALLKYWFGFPTKLIPGVASLAERLVQLKFRPVAAGPGDYENGLNEVKEALKEGHVVVAVRVERPLNLNPKDYLRDILRHIASYGVHALTVFGVKGNTLMTIDNQGSTAIGNEILSITGNTHPYRNPVGADDVGNFVFFISPNPV